MRPRGMGLLTWLVLGLLLPWSAGPAAPGDEAAPTQQELAERLANAKQEARDHAAARAAAEAERRQAMADLGITGFAKLGTHGDPGRCLDIVFIGDGFAAKDQQAYAGYVDEMVAQFDTPPFDALAAHVNFYRVDLVAAQSGIKLDDNPVEAPLGGEVNPFVGGKLLSVDPAKVIRAVRAAVPQADYINVVLNTFERFRGSANSGIVVKLSTARGHRRSIVVHEFGHNFGGLLDEYVDPKQSGGRKPPAMIERSANASLESNAYLARWHHWNVPEAVFRGEVRGKPVKWEDNVRCFEGAATFPEGVYRPEENCHMQRGRGKHFCRACREVLELATYRFFEPIRSVSPLTDRCALGLRDKLEFRVEPARLADAEQAVRVAWYLDGRRRPDRKTKVEKLKSGALSCTCPLRGSDIGAGTHHLTAVLDVVTQRVHMDRGWLSASFTWTLEVSAKGPQLLAPTKRMALTGQAMSFEVKPAAGSAPGTWRLVNPPQGASFDPEGGLFSWSPTGEQVGAHRLLFARDGGDPARAAAVLVTVKPAEKRRNKGPKFLFVPDQVGREGRRLAVTLYAYDPDGDRLAWSAKALPRGARLDAASGAFTWDVGLTQRGRHSVEFEVTDGQKADRKAVEFDIDGAALFRGMFSRGQRGSPEPGTTAFDDPVDWMLVGLHHPDVKVLATQVERLARAPAPVRLAESLRLLREVAAPITAAAQASVQAIFEEAAGARDAQAASWHLDAFLDEMPRRAWQFVDRPEVLAAVDGWCELALGSKGLSKSHAKALAALREDLEVIAAYNRWRREQPPLPPVTDKKFK